MSLSQDFRCDGEAVDDKRYARASGVSNVSQVAENLLVVFCVSCEGLFVPNKS